MGIKINAFIGLIFSILIYYIYSGYFHNDKIYVPKTGYFGVGEERPDDLKIYPFQVNVSQNLLNDLKIRLKNARIGHRQLEDVEDFSYGINLATLKTFQNYWMEKFDWKKSEAILNSFNQFTTEIEGLKIHFIHVKPKVGTKKQVIPLLLVHGWPGNVFEFYKIIPLLLAESKDSDFVFEIVAPSIPGYGWSEQPKKTGFSPASAARIFNKLMVDRLGFNRYIAQGGDWGSIIVTNLGHLHPENLIGLHLNMNSKLITGSFRYYMHLMAGLIAPKWMFGKEFSNFSLKAILWPMIKETGYLHLQATKPDTVGVGLNDSPIGLLAYILEKFSYWTNPDYILLNDGGLEKKFTKDELLTIITIYWVNQNILSSQRFYKENIRDPVNAYLNNRYMSVPCGFALGPYDLIPRFPKELLEHNFNLTHYTNIPKGGHFLAFEEPVSLAKDIFKFTKKLTLN